MDVLSVSVDCQEGNVEGGGGMVVIRCWRCCCFLWLEGW